MNEGSIIVKENNFQSKKNNEKYVVKSSTE